MERFEDWFKSFDIHKVSPLTEVYNEEEIKVFLKLAWEDGFAEGYEVASEEGNNGLRRASDENETFTLSEV